MFDYLKSVFITPVEEVVEPEPEYEEIPDNSTWIGEVFFEGDGGIRMLSRSFATSTGEVITIQTVAEE